MLSPNSAIDVYENENNNENENDVFAPSYHPIADLGVRDSFDS